MANPLNHSFFVCPVTQNEWDSRVGQDLEALVSLSDIDFGKKIYYQEGRFSTTWRISEYFKGWFSIVDAAADYVGSYEEALYRSANNFGSRNKYSVNTTIDGLRAAKFHIKGTLAIANRILSGENSPVSLSDLQKDVETIQFNLTKAKKGLENLQKTYQSTSEKQLILKPAIEDFFEDLTPFVQKVAKKVSKAIVRVKYKSLFEVAEVKPQPAPPSPVASVIESMERSVPLVPILPNNPQPSPFLFPNKDQLKFNETLEARFLAMKQYVETHREEILAKADKPLRIKKNGEMPWSIVVTPEKKIYFYMNVTIVPKGEGGAIKQDKRVFDFSNSLNIAKLSVRLYPSEDRKIIFAKREAEILKKCTLENVPFIVKLSDVIWKEYQGYSKQVLYLEHCLHGDLKSNLRRIGHDRAKLKRILLGVIRGIAELHLRNIVHRDIKPGNIFLDLEDNPKIGDLGGASYINQDEKAEGTPLYMPPEVLKVLGMHKPGKVTASPTHDVWSFGMILYALLKNPKAKEPWPWAKGIRGKYPKDTFNLLLKNTILKKDFLFPEPPKEDVWMHICWEALRIDPSKRPTAQQILNRLTIEEVWNWTNATTSFSNSSF